MKNETNEISAEQEAENLIMSMYYADLNNISYSEATSCAIITVNKMIIEFKELKIKPLEEKWKKVKDKLLNKLIEYKTNSIQKNYKLCTVE